MNYNSKDFINLLTVLKISGRNYTPPFQLNYLKTPKGDNKKISYIEKGERELIATCLVKGNSLSAIWTNINANIAPFLYPTSTDYKSLIFADQSTKRWNAIISGELEVIKESHDTVIFEVPFLCELYAYGTTQVTAENIDAVEKTNAGTAYTFGKITFTLASPLAADLNITLAGTTGAYVIKTGAPAGAYEIDLEKRILKIDAVLANTNIDSYLSRPETFVIAPGKYTINFDQVVDADHVYYPRYL